MNTRVIKIATIPEISEIEVKGKTISVNQPIMTTVFEKRQWLYRFILPIMWLLTFYVIIKKSICKLFGKPAPKINSFWFDGLGLSPKKVKENATFWKALDEIYTYDFGRSITLRNLVDNFWEGMRNCQAVRNRFKLVKQELRRAILQFSNHKEVRLISLACGSAQAVIEVMAELKNQGIVVRTILIDIDQSALDYANGLAKRYNMLSQIKTIKASASQIVRISHNFKPQIVEMVGLLDYIPQKKAIRLAIKIREALEFKGIFITSNIAPNSEMHFIHWVVNWPMIYRRPQELAEIMNEAGFSDYRLIYEPLKIHGLAIAQKNSV